MAVKKTTSPQKEWNLEFNSIAATIVSGSGLLLKLFDDYQASLYALEITDVPDISQWLNFYKNHRAINRKMLELVIHAMDNDHFPIKTSWLQVKRLFESFNISIPLLIDQVYFLSKAEKEELLSKLNSLDYDDVAAKAPKDLAKRSMALPMAKEDLLKSPEFTFFVRVCFPCWLIYGEYPTILFRKARQGDLNSICMLLQLDKSITGDKRIGHFIHKASLIPGSDDYKKICNSMNKTLKISSGKKMKLIIAGLISQYAKQLEIQHTAPQLHRVFDQVARLQNSDYIDDPDLEMNPEAFYMHLRRQPRKWQVILDKPTISDPDKK